MKFIRQFCIIIVISLLGEILKRLIPLPVPASIYGLVLLLAALQTGLIPLAAVRETSLFLVEIMPLMFIPAAVGLLESWGVLKPILPPVSIILVITTIVVMAVTGRVTQFVIRLDNRKKEQP